MSEIELKDAYIVGELRHIVATGEGDMLWINRHYAAALLSAIDVPAPQWQPIESAPKDGMAVLATSAHMTGPNGEPVAWAAVFDQERGRWTATWDGEPLNDATHWQPLPAPPEVAA